MGVKSRNRGDALASLRLALMRAAVFVREALPWA